LNLTKDQQDDFRWLVEKVQNGEISEGNIVFCLRGDGWYYLAEEKDRLKVALSTLKAWQKEKLIVQSSHKDTSFMCGLTENAYKVVESGFDAPGKSATSFELNGGGYVSATRIEALKAIESEQVDLTRLIRMCEELDIAQANGLNLSMIMLLRAILDHVPPIFSKNSFKAVASEHGTKSFKETMNHLQNGARKIADSHLHVQIRKKEVLPTYLQVNFSQHLDALLAEVVAILQSETV
jgi:hypothetical protein